MLLFRVQRSLQQGRNGSGAEQDEVGSSHHPAPPPGGTTWFIAPRRLPDSSACFSFQSLISHGCLSLASVEAILDCCTTVPNGNLLPPIPKGRHNQCSLNIPTKGAQINFQFRQRIWESEKAMDLGRWARFLNTMLHLAGGEPYKLQKYRQWTNEPSRSGAQIGVQMLWDWWEFAGEMKQDLGVQ